MIEKPATDPILPDVESALDLYDVSATAFGYFAAGDPTLLAKMRKGMHLRDRRRGKVKRALKRIYRNRGIPK